MIDQHTNSGYKKQHQVSLMLLLWLFLFLLSRLLLSLLALPAQKDVDDDRSDGL